MLTLDHAGLRRAGTIAAAVTGLFVIATALRWSVADPVATGAGATLLRQGDLASENVLAAWWAATLLLWVSALAALSAASVLQGHGGRAVAIGWLCIAGATAYMSLDELGSVHERLGAVQRGSAPPGLLRETNLLILAFLLGVGPALAFVALLRSHHRRAATLVVAALACFAVGLFGDHGGGVLWERPAPGERPPLLSLLLEEGGEVAGALCLLFAGTRFLAEAAPAAGISSSAVRLFGLAVPLLLGVGLVVVLLLRLPPRFGIGDPVTWFPSALALASAAGALVMCRGSERRFALAFAALATVVAIDAGVAELFSEQLWPGSPRRRVAQAIAIAALAVWIAGRAGRATSSVPLRVAMAVWAAGVSVGWVMSGQLRSLVLFAAHAAVLPAIAYASSHKPLDGGPQSSNRLLERPPGKGRARTAP
jgi:hypothetical protein